MEKGAKGAKDALQRMWVSINGFPIYLGQYTNTNLQRRLRWAKKEKKRTQANGPSQTSPLLNGHGSVSTHSMASA